jgi:peptidyl-prolyl cis-trans isomerase C
MASVFFCNTMGKIMMLIRAISLISFIFSASVLASEQYVVQDGDVGLTGEELKHIMALWTPEMREAASKDTGDRLELINMAVASKKLAALADTIPPEDDPEAYWRQIFTIRSIQSQYVVNHYLDSIDVPDMSALAMERYETQKDKYALVKEERYSSHILLLCEPGSCDREPRRVEARKILEELDAGADFRELAAKYSEDPGSKDSGGKFDRWLKKGEPQVEPTYVGAVFDIEKAGEYSGVVDSRYGLHIIRLDEIRPAYYKSFEEVKDQIEAALRGDYIKLSAKQYDARFRFTDNTLIDYDAIEEILQSYQTPEPAAE